MSRKREEELASLNERIDNLRRWIRANRGTIEFIQVRQAQLECALDCFERQRTQLAEALAKDV